MTFKSVRPQPAYSGYSLYVCNAVLAVIDLAYPSETSIQKMLRSVSFLYWKVFNISL